jgi:hypothetical protein
MPTDYLSKWGLLHEVGLTVDSLRDMMRCHFDAAMPDEGAPGKRKS